MSGPTCRGQQPTSGGYLQSQRSSPRSEGSKLHIRLPSQGFCTNKSPSRRTGGLKKQILLFKGTHKISHAPSPRPEAVICNVPGSDPFADLEEHPGEAGGYQDFPGARDAGCNHSGELHWCWQTPLGILPPAYQQCILWHQSQQCIVDLSPQSRGKKQN